MQAVRFHEYGGAEVLRLDDVTVPQPGVGEVRLRVAGSAFNPVDDGIRGGYLQDAFPVQLPHTPGVEVAGTVDALGDGVDGVAVGDTVIAFLPMLADGSAADAVIAPGNALVTAPTTVPLADAAALPMVGLTAWQALFDHGGLNEGQRILINGAGGAVGGYAIQLAKWAGATVIATASPRSAERVRALGADEVIDHTAGDVAVDEPVDILLNLARLTPEAFEALADQVRDGGIIVNTVPTIEVPADEARGLRSAGVFVRSDTEQLSRLVELVDAGTVTVTVDERIPLDALPEVHAKAAAGTPTGRVVAVPAL